MGLILTAKQHAIKVQPAQLVSEIVWNYILEMNRGEKLEGLVRELKKHEMKISHFFSSLFKRSM